MQVKSIVTIALIMGVEIHCIVAQVVIHLNREGVIIEGVTPNIEMELIAQDFFSLWRLNV